MIVQILVDNINSYIVPYALRLVNELNLNSSIQAKLLHNHHEVVEGDILVLLSCQKIFKLLHLNKNNIVVHASKLPKGRGWSPLSWQILEGKNIIPLTLFEANNQVDDGCIYIQDEVVFDGSELLDELQTKLSDKIIEMVKQFVISYPKNQKSEQVGIPTFYSKRVFKDSELDIHKSIDEQFNLLRICDNVHYPAFFIRDGIRYIIQIQKELTNERI